MARADLLLNLVRAGARGEHAQFQKTVEALAADERAKHHGVLADRLIAQLQTDANGRNKTMPTISPRAAAGPLVATLTPRQTLERLILSPQTALIIRELIEEQQRVDLLRSFNLEPRNRILLAGPPGNGKTSLAEAISESISVPFLVVRYEAVIGSYLGETAQRISQVFELARTQNCVLFFDEFDAIGKERGDLHETGEIKRVVSSLLLQIDSLPSYVIVIAASNHPELLDRAVWRRFQIRIELPLPNRAQIEEWFKRFITRSGHVFGVSPQILAEKLYGASFSEVEEFGVNTLRRIALSEPESSNAEITKQCLAQWMLRFSINRNSTRIRK